MAVRLRTVRVVREVEVSLCKKRGYLRETLRVKNGTFAKSFLKLYLVITFVTRGAGLNVSFAGESRASKPSPPPPPSPVVMLVMLLRPLAELGPLGM